MVHLVQLVMNHALVSNHAIFRLVQLVTSRVGENACRSQSGTVGDQSCTKGNDGNGNLSCGFNQGIIGDRSCTEVGACQRTSPSSKIGNDSW